MEAEHMSFVRKSTSLKPIKDTVFVVAAAAAKDQDPSTCNATIGSLYDENGQLVAYDSVYDHYDSISHIHKAKYAASFTGNNDFRKAVASWVFQGTEMHLPHTVIATPGGSGADFMAIRNTLEEGDTLLIPDICWGSYSLMAAMNNISIRRYTMFESDHFNLASVKEEIEAIQKTQDHVTLVVNDPCHNPTGYSMSDQEWKDLIALLNEEGKKTPIVLIDDIAYIDYAYNPKMRAYMNHFNEISGNVMIVVAFSCSKTMTAYGLRCGAAVAVAKNEADVRAMEIVMEKTARATWSSIPNAAMEEFVWLTSEGLDAYLKEKQGYIDLLRERSGIFLQEAKECNLPCWPYKEGFFVTVKVENPEDLDPVHDALMNAHIYTVEVNKGIRVAVCSLPVKKVKGLAARMKAVFDAYYDRKGK